MATFLVYQAEDGTKKCATTLIEDSVWGWIKERTKDAEKPLTIFLITNDQQEAFKLVLEDTIHRPSH